MNLKHFDHAELGCFCCNEVQLADGFGKALDELRETLGAPMVVNSCCRCAPHNAQLITQGLPAHPTSLHMIENPKWKIDTCAIDIHAVEAAYRGRLIAIAWGKGWSVGMGGRFLHLDRRTDTIGLPQVTFHY